MKKVEGEIWNLNKLILNLDYEKTRNKNKIRIY